MFEKLSKAIIVGAGAKPPRLPFSPLDTRRCSRQQTEERCLAYRERLAPQGHRRSVNEIESPT
jgi:hypothetical protein